MHHELRDFTENILTCQDKTTASIAQYNEFANSCLMQTDTFRFIIIHNQHVQISLNKFN